MTKFMSISSRFWIGCANFETATNCALSLYNPIVVIYGSATPEVNIVLRVSPGNILDWSDIDSNLSVAGVYVALGFIDTLN